VKLAILPCSLPSVINTCHMPTVSNASFSGQVVKGAPKNKVYPIAAVNDCFRAAAASVLIQ